MNYTFQTHEVSDLHKDVFGFRPDYSWWSWWTNATNDQRQAEWDMLVSRLEQEDGGRQPDESQEWYDYDPDC